MYRWLNNKGEDCAWSNIVSHNIETGVVGKYQKKGFWRAHLTILSSAAKITVDETSFLPLLCQKPWLRTTITAILIYSHLGKPYNYDSKWPGSPTIFNFHIQFVYNISHAVPTMCQPVFMLHHSRQQLHGYTPALPLSICRFPGTQRGRSSQFVLPQMVHKWFMDKYSNINSLTTTYDKEDKCPFMDGHGGA